MKAFLQSVARLYTLPATLVLFSIIVAGLYFHPQLGWRMKIISVDPSKYQLEKISSDYVRTDFEETPHLNLSVVSTENDEYGCVVPIQQEVSYVKNSLLLEKERIEGTTDTVQMIFSGILVLSLIYIVANIVYTLFKKEFSVSVDIFIAILLPLIPIWIGMISGPIINPECCPCFLNDDIVKVKIQAELINADYSDLPSLAWSSVLSGIALILMFFRVYFLFWNKPKPDLNSNN